MMLSLPRCCQLLDIGGFGLAGDKGQGCAESKLHDRKATPAGFSHIGP